MRSCCKCGNEINPLRVKALPETKVCVNCSTTKAWYVRNIISGKTEYAETEIIKDADAASNIRKMDQRLGWGSNLYKG
jgi:recombinational DNA repair protein (RecF pathway)